ncbi:MAG: cellulase family glycosylhydrolase [Anaerolineales bacterium]|nr:cellulase family glycosylhydrolase [Anaerolineales bacterium]
MIKTDGVWFKDEAGRALLLRGVNLGGSTKVPFTPDGATYIREGFFDHRAVSFVGRPFPLEEADEHYARLRKWGLTFLRFLVTWEAVEHAGPGSYDEEYLDYLYAVVQKAAEYDIQLFIDPHQDVWSRFSGGDGAPGWAFEAVGMDITKFSETGAAIVHQIHGDPFPRMIWPTNNTKLAAATMFTLFFGGNDFAPQTKVDGMPVQEYLQSHYINAIRQIAERLKGLPHVVGYDTLNEPYPGYIGWEDLNHPEAEVEMGPIPSPLQSMALGAGIPQYVDVWDRRMTGPKKIETRLLNPEGVSLWMDGYEPVWKANGVWDAAGGEVRLLRPDHFTRVDGKPISFNQDYLRPFANRYAAEIRAIDSTPERDPIIFVETVPMQELPQWGPEDAHNIASAPHWYDGVVLFMKTFNPMIGIDARTLKIQLGKRRIRKSFAEQLRRYKREAADYLGGVPTLIGEIGIAYDLDDKKAFRTGDFSQQVQAFDRTMVALEDALVSATLWNYTADNTNERGDLWNDEDLSLFSRDQQDDPSDLDSGGRALEAVVRPYAMKTAGTPLVMSFDHKTKVFAFQFEHDPAVDAPTEIFVPETQYPNGCNVQVSDGEYEIDAERQLLIYRHSPALNYHHIHITPKR